MATTMETLNDLFVEQIADLYDAEQQLVKALPKMAGAATSPKLRTAFEKHLKQTEQHVKKLEQVFQSIDAKVQGEHCDAMEGLISEGSEVVSKKGNSAVKDIALVTAAQRVEHYELAGYGNARELAEHLGLDEAKNILDGILVEEGEANRMLTKITKDELLAEAPTA
jgi:ferritin-like metal-binding protein YciE